MERKKAGKRGDGKGRKPTETDISSLRIILLRRREEMFERVRRLHSGITELSEREIETGETAQEVEVSKSYELLDGRDEAEIVEIDRALNKMGTGTYGICETCGDVIDLARLRALPWTRYCLRDEEEYEKQHKRPEPARETSLAKAGAEYEGIPDDQLEDEIRAAIQGNGPVDLEELTIRVRDRAVILGGTLPSEKAYLTVLQVLGEMGLEVVEDRVEIQRSPLDRESRLKLTKKGDVAEP